MTYKHGYGPYDQRPDQDDLPHHEWKCDECGAVNSCLDAECQFCEGPMYKD